MATEATAQDGGGKKKGHAGLTIAIVGAITLAIVIALLFPNLATKFEVGGEVFLRLLQMVVVPLVMASVMSGILGLGDVRKLGRPGGYAILYYMSTTILAVIVGLVVVNLINPGKHVDPQLVEEAREEGAQEVNRVAEASGKKPVEVTWNLETVTVREQSGTSDVLTVPAHQANEAAVYLVQKSTGQIAQPASMQLFFKSKKGEDFELLTWEDKDGQQWDRFTAPAESGRHKQVIPIPAEAHQLKVEYSAMGAEGYSAVEAEVGPGPPTIGDIARNLVLMLFSDNLLGSMVHVNLLPLIVFSIVFAGMLTTMGSRAETISKLVISINDALLNFILLLMKVAPIGIFCLVAARFGKAQADGKFIELINVQLYYVLTVLSGLAFHAFVTLPILLFVFSRRNPIRFMIQMSQAVLTAFSTASSTATLPVTMECAEVKAGVSRRSTEFVLPLGATINMDGTALYEAAAAIFIAQALGLQLDWTQQAVIAITATLAAVGAAGIPEAGLVTLLIVLNAVGLPLELIGLILPVDWFLDRFRTAVNAFGDSVGAAIVDRSFEAEAAKSA